MTEAEKQNYKANILTDFFNTGLLDVEVKKMCARNRINHATLIHEDVISEVYLHLSKLKADYLIKVHDEDKNLLGLACRIAITKGFSKHKKNPSYHKHSLALNILFMSNLNKYETVCNTGEFDSDDGNDRSYQTVLKVNPDEQDCISELFELIRSKLTISDNKFLDQVLFGKKKRGRYKNSVKVKREKLFNKIKAIVAEEKNQLVMTQEQKFESIKQLISKLDEYRMKGTVTFSDSTEIDLLRQVYKVVYPVVTLDVSCTTCILHALNILLAYYEREYPLYMKQLEASTETKEIDSTVKQSKKKGNRK